MRRSIAPRTEHATVCIVDPRPEDYGRLTTSAWGLLFQFATCASDALKLSRTSGRTIWLVNINLPDGSGCDLAAAIRARDPRSVVYLVGDQYDPAEEVKARMAGGAMYVCKPADGGWLESITHRAVVMSDSLAQCA